MKKYVEYWVGKIPLKALLRPALLLAVLLWPLLYLLSDNRKSYCWYSLMEPGLLPEEASPIGPLYLPFEDVYAFYREQKTTQTQANVDDWRRRMCLPKKYEQGIYELVYKADRSTLKLLKTALRSKSMSLPYGLRGNAFARYLRKQGCFETVDYLLYARDCEPYLIATDAWEDEGRDVAVMQQLIEAGKKAFAKCSSDYLRLRYLYQLMRLAHYKGSSKQALSLYDTLMPFILLPETSVKYEEGREDYSIIYFWVQELRAGALQAVGERAEAARLFAFVFLHRPERRASCYASFKLLSDSEWKRALSLCEDDDERATLYALRAHVPDSRALEEMEAIYELGARPDYLEVLLLKEIKELERSIMVRFYPYQRKLRPERFATLRPHPDEMSYLIDMQAFVHKVSASGQAPHPGLWQIAEAYLFLLAGDYYEAQKLLEQLRLRVSKKALARQLGVLEVFAEITSFSAASLPGDEHRDTLISEIETGAYNLLLESKWINDNPNAAQASALKAYLIDRMAQLYHQLDHPGLEFRCLYPRDFFLRLNPQEKIVEDLIEVLDELKKLELQLDSTEENQWRFPFRKALTLSDEHTNLRPYLSDIRGVMMLQQANVPAALDYFNEVPPFMRDDLGSAAPFLFYWVDTSYTTRVLDSAEVYNRYEFARKLLDLKYKIEANVDDPSKLYFRMGLGWYNTTFFGPAWILRDHYRDPNNWSRLREDSIYPYPGSPYGNVEVMDVDLPLYYFRQALTHARLNGNFDLAAAAAYMAAKCEQIKYFQSKQFPGIPKGNVIPKVPDEYRTYFRLIHTEFKDTGFHADLLEECLYFRNYVMRTDSAFFEE